MNVRLVGSETFIPQSEIDLAIDATAQKLVYVAQNLKFCEEAQEIQVEAATNTNTVISGTATLENDKSDDNQSTECVTTCDDDDNFSEDNGSNDDDDGDTDDEDDEIIDHNDDTDGELFSL